MNHAVGLVQQCTHWSERSPTIVV